MLNYLNRDKLWRARQQYIISENTSEIRFFPSLVSRKWPRDGFSLVQIHFSYSLLKFNDMENYAIRQIELRFFDRPRTHIEHSLTKTHEY